MTRRRENTWMTPPTKEGGTRWPVFGPENLEHNPHFVPPGAVGESRRYQERRLSMILETRAAWNRAVGRGDNPVAAILRLPREHHNAVAETTSLLSHGGLDAASQRQIGETLVARVQEWERERAQEREQAWATKGGRGNRRASRRGRGAREPVLRLRAWKRAGLKPGIRASDIERWASKLGPAGIGGGGADLDKRTGELRLWVWPNDFDPDTITFGTPDDDDLEEWEPWDGADVELAVLALLGRAT
jgi:hypothetical protein